MKRIRGWMMYWRLGPLSWLYFKRWGLAGNIQDR
jgi:hypothetical protein